MNRSYSRGGEGHVKLIPEEGEPHVRFPPACCMKSCYFCYHYRIYRLLREQAYAGEDMWHVFNLVRAGDRVTAVTFRKIAVHGAGGSESERVKLKLTISVEAVDFDPEGQPRLP